MQAIACVDSAIWDAVGKYANEPLWRLWGGYRDRIPMIGIGGKPPEEDAKRLRLARSIVGEDIIFVVDANQGYTVNEALAFLVEIEGEIPLRWFEEPTRWHADCRGLCDVRPRGNINVAAGQSEISRVGMREMMVNIAIDICNYDASWGGGPTEWPRIVNIYVKFFASNFNADRKAAAVTITLASGDSTEYTLTNLDFIIYGGDGYANVFSPSKDILLIRVPFAHNPLIYRGF